MAQVQQREIFVSNTLPDIDPQSHIIGLAGIDDYDDQADPSKDGWFLSDFYLFNHLLSGVCRTQAWYTCVDPNQLVTKYQEFAHGNPYYERRIVLDREMLAEIKNIVVTEPDRLLAEFWKYLRATCHRAHVAHEPVLLFIFGHGDDYTKGIEVGRLMDGTIPMLHRDMMKELLVDFPELRLSTMMTSCYSGGWTTYVDMTIMAAAGADQQSESWPASHSLGRATGSIFASVILDQLRKEDRQLDERASDALSYRRFTEGVKAELLLLDRFGDCYDVQFSAQNDDWEAEYHDRTGIPVTIFQNRLKLLRTIPSTDRMERPYGDRTSDERLRQLGVPPLNDANRPVAASMRGRHGGSAQSVRSLMRNRAARYLTSYPGRDSLANNHLVHKLARDCLQNSCTWEGLYTLARCLDYREKAIKVAQSLLPIMRVDPFVPHWTWDLHAWEMEPAAPARRDRSAAIWQRIVDAKLIPKPAQDEGRPWGKPAKYLTAALVAQELTDDEIQRRIERARTWLEGQIQAVTKLYKRSWQRTLAGQSESWKDAIRA